MKIKNNDVIVFFGDSVTDCSRKKPDGEGSIISPDAWGTGYVNFVRLLRITSHPEVKIRILNKGSNGQRSIDLLERLEDDVLSYKPNIVFILIGVNDAWRNFEFPARGDIHTNEKQYEENVRLIISRIINAKSEVVLLTPFMIERERANDPFRQQIEKFATVCKNLADEFKLDIIDLQKLFDDALEKMDITSLTPDRIHPAQTGQLLIANKINDYLK